MRRQTIMLILFLAPYILQGQEFKIKKNKINVNQDIVAFYKANIKLYSDVNGDSIIYIPFEKTFLPGIKIRDINGFIVGYEITHIGLEKKITLHPTKNSGYEFNFGNGKYKLRKDKNDDNDFFKPKDLREKLEKAEKIEPKEQKGDP